MTNRDINRIFGRPGNNSRHLAITDLISFFNRLSEEMIVPQTALKMTKDDNLRTLLKLYKTYLDLLANNGREQRYTDLSLLQQEAVKLLQSNNQASKVFKHVIIDEYQDTNPVQERLFFLLAKGYKNICVVGDD